MGAEIEIGSESVAGADADTSLIDFVSSRAISKVLSAGILSTG